MGLARRTITSISWNFLITPVTIGILLVRSIWLARLLPVNTFGAYAFASSIVALTIIFPRFGLADAFFHRSPETVDENNAAQVHFTLKLLLAILWATLLIAFALIFMTGDTQTALIILTITSTVLLLTETPRIILRRRIVYRRLTLMQVATAVLTTVVAVFLARRGATLWALLAVDVTTVIIAFFAMYIWRPVWRPGLRWSPQEMRYFLQFGSRAFSAALLSNLLNRIDNLWTGVYLGNTSLGFYSRAYRFATYPREPVAKPVNRVIAGTYAELKEDRLRLSQTFFRASSLLIRSGYLFAGLLFLVAPEFILLFLGEKWLPMLPALRLMLLFTLLDPLKVTTSRIFVAVGKPGEIIPVRLLQLAILVTGLFLLGPRFDIAGVASAVNVMVLVGTVILLWKVRAYVDFSIRKMFAAPTIALLLALSPVLLLNFLELSFDSHWMNALIKALMYTSIYSTVLLFLERRHVSEILPVLYRSYRTDHPVNDRTFPENDHVQE